MRFRKKPIVIEAEQWFPSRCGNCTHSKEILSTGPNIAGVAHSSGGSYDRHVVFTLEGLMEVSPGDWIITGVKGEKYPCKPDIFSATYELVTE